MEITAVDVAFLGVIAYVLAAICVFVFSLISYFKPASSRKIGMEILYNFCFVYSIALFIVGSILVVVSAIFSLSGCL